MADKYLNSNGVYTIVSEAYKQAVGEKAVATQDLADFCETGVAYDTLIADNAWKDPFTKALLNQTVKNFYLDTLYEGDSDDPFYVDKRRFGAIVQMISAEAPEVQASHSWQQFVSGTTKVGQYDVYIPIVDAKCCGKSSSWELPITITNEQWDPAFKNANELETFVAFIFMTVDNALTQHLEDENRLNVANFIGEKIAYAASQGAEGIHVLDLRALYEAETGDDTITTAEGFMADDKCMRFAAEKFDEYAAYMQRQTQLFNVDGKVKFTPKSRLVCEVLQKFESRMKSVSYADAYNLEYVKLPKHIAVPYWQGMGLPASGTGAADFDEVSAIKIKTASGTTVSQVGIVGLLADQYAVMHTILDQRIAHEHFDFENLDTYMYQFRDQRINNLQQNGLVFVVLDKPVGD